MRGEFFKLPLDALTHVVSSSDTCVGELKLFKAMQDRIAELQANNSSDALAIQNQVIVLKDLMSRFIRLSQLDVKRLVTDIKFSGIFEDGLLFKAIQYNVAKEVLDEDTVMRDIRFVPRGLSTYFDFKHFDLSVEVIQESDDRDVSAKLDLLPCKGNHLFRIKRDRVCQSTDDSCLSAIMSEPLPLHGIHYWEFKVRAAKDPKQARLEQTEVQKSDLVIKDTVPEISAENDATNTDDEEEAKSSVASPEASPKPATLPHSRPVKPRQLFIGLCQVNDNHSMEDTHLVQSSVMLNALDSNFWCNGQQMQTFHPAAAKNIPKIKNPFEQDRRPAASSSLLRNAARGQSALLSQERNLVNSTTSGPLLRSPQTSSVQMNLAGASRTSQQSSDSAPAEP